MHDNPTRRSIPKLVTLDRADRRSLMGMPAPIGCPLPFSASDIPFLPGLLPVNMDEVVGLGSMIVAYSMGNAERAQLHGVANSMTE